MEQGRTLPHKLTLNERRELAVTGVTEVVSFEDTLAVLRTGMGLLTVQGQQLQLKGLSQEDGLVSVTGQVSAMVYQEQRAGGGWLSRLLG